MHDCLSNFNPIFWSDLKYKYLVSDRKITVKLNKHSS